jgi:hypothetical protein
MKAMHTAIPRTAQSARKISFGRNQKMNMSGCLHLPNSKAVIVLDSRALSLFKCSRMSMSKRLLRNMNGASVHVKQSLDMSRRVASKMTLAQKAEIVQERKITVSCPLPEEYMRSVLLNVIIHQCVSLFFGQIVVRCGLSNEMLMITPLSISPLYDLEE